MDYLIYHMGLSGLFYIMSSDNDGDVTGVRNFQKVLPYPVTMFTLSKQTQLCIETETFAAEGDPHPPLAHQELRVVVPAEVQ
jgi:hypothetical protein